ncbi:hypothetical protein E2562_000267 [Oryza meyeriana var. granulata]|uniref:Uncharacterized protein n=1 Tax=Oryza meyeriana var. granulata TaxID=110450 RepID=A0A6G1CML6_9ORYZ|nr:hypothetical protein E2562_000267 [Oryza meyeriana var. granulata]
MQIRACSFELGRGAAGAKAGRTVVGTGQRRLVGETGPGHTAEGLGGVGRWGSSPPARVVERRAPGELSSARAIGQLGRQVRAVGECGPGRRRGASAAWRQPSRFGGVGDGILGMEWGWVDPWIVATLVDR